MSSSSFYDLCDDVLHEIFSFLDLSSLLLGVSLASHSTYELVHSSPLIWRNVRIPMAAGKALIKGHGLSILEHLLSSHPIEELNIETCILLANVWADDPRNPRRRTRQHRQLLRPIYILPAFPTLKRLFFNPATHWSIIDCFRTNNPDVAFIPSHCPSLNPFRLRVRLVTRPESYVHCHPPTPHPQPGTFLQFIVRVPMDPTIAQLKDSVASYSGIKPSCQRGIFAGKSLEDGRRLRSDYNVTSSGSIIWMILRLRSSSSSEEGEDSESTHWDAIPLMKGYRRLRWWHNSTKEFIGSEMIEKNCVLEEEND